MNQSLVSAVAGIYGRFWDKRLFALEFLLGDRRRRSNEADYSRVA
jgi:hypothetical protein